MMLTRKQMEEKLSRAFSPEQTASLVEVVDEIRQAELERAADTRELRRGLTGLTEEVRKLAEAQRRTEERLAGFEERTERRLAGLAEAQERTDAAVRELAEAQARTEHELQALTAQVRSLAETMGEMLLERRYRERPLLYFRRLLSELRVLSEQEVWAMTAPSLSDEELDGVLAADVIASGRRPDGTAAYLVAEISQTVRLYDVERAAERARLLSQATGSPVLSVVAGGRIREAAEQAARQAGVWRVMDGRTYAPDQPVSREQVAGS